MNQELIKDIIQWDIKSWSKALFYWEEKIDWNSIQNGLELGGNQGGLSLWIALKGKQTICSDLSNVKQSAEQLHKRYQVSEFIQYQDIDAGNIPFENHFDLIVFKSILGGIGRDNNYEIQKRVLKEAHKALKPGGKLLFAENLKASYLHQQMRKKFIKWGSSWRYVSLNEMNNMLVDFSSVELKATGVLGSFGRTENQRNFLATLDTMIFNSIYPRTWKYICYGIAVK